MSRLPDAEDWPAFTAEFPMQTHAWMRARMELLPPAMPRHLFAIEDSLGTQALAPLYRNGDWLREPPLMSEPSDLLWHNSENLQTLANSLARQSLPIYLERLPAESPTLPALRQAYARRGLVLVEPAMPTPFIRLEGRGRDSDAWFNAGRRSDFRRAERRAAGFGTVSYEIHSPDGATDLTSLLDEAYTVEARSWKGYEGTALVNSAILGDFFARFTRYASRQGILRLAFLRVDGYPIAMQIACEWRQRFWLLKIGYDPAFASCSPGQLMLRHTLRHAAATGLRSYEFLGEMEDWTQLWTSDVRHYVQVRAIPFNATGLKILAKRGARATINRLRTIAR